MSYFQFLIKVEYQYNSEHQLCHQFIWKNSTSQHISLPVISPFPETSACKSQLTFDICLQTSSKLRLVLYFSVLALIYWPPITRMRFPFLSLILSPPRLPELHIGIFPISSVSLWFYVMILSILDLLHCGWLFFMSTAQQLSWGPSFNFFCCISYFLDSKSLFWVYSLILVQQIILHEKSCMQGKFQTLRNQFSISVFIHSLAGYRILDWKSFRSLKA